MSGFVAMCRDLSRYVLICRDVSEYVAICRDMSEFVRICREMPTIFLLGLNRYHIGIILDKTLDFLDLF